MRGLAPMVVQGQTSGDNASLLEQHIQMMLDERNVWDGLKPAPENSPARIDWLMEATALLLEAELHRAKAELRRSRRI